MKKNIALFASVLSLTFSAAPDANAQWVQTTGPSYTNCLTVSGANLFAGGDSFYLTTDKGTSWTASGLPNPHINALAMSGTNLFAGTYTLYAGHVSEVFLSADSGKSWTAANNGFSPGAPEVTAFAVSGTNASPMIFAGTFGSGIFLSTDNGSSWTAVNNGFPTTPLQSFSTAPEVYAFALTGTNTPSPTLFAGTADSGVYRSTNNGTSWTVINNGLPNYLTEYVKSLAVIGTNGSSPMLFAGIHATAGNPGGGVHLSTDNGASWMDASNGLTSPYVDDLAVSGSNLFAGTYNAGVYLSTDSGASWTAVNTGLTNLTLGITALAVIGKYLFAGTDGNGVWRRPLSDFGISAVSEPKIAAAQIQSYPNPFSQSTTISFSSPESGAAEVTVVNLLGSEMARLFEGELDAGPHSFMWSKPTSLPDGMYECVVRMNGHAQELPLVLTR